MKYWDATALTRQLHDLLASQLTDINKAFNTAFCLHSKVLINKQEEVIHSTEKSMDAEIKKLAMIMLDFTIQQRLKTVFLKKNILHLFPTTKETCAVEFQSDYWKSKYVTYYRKNMEAMKRFQVNFGENYANVLILEFEYMHRSCIYASILGFLDISGQKTTRDLIMARKKSAESGLSIADGSRFIGQKIFDCS